MVATLPEPAQSTQRQRWTVASLMVRFDRPTWPLFQEWLILVKVSPGAVLVAAHVEPADQEARVGPSVFRGGRWNWTLLSVSTV